MFFNVFKLDAFFRILDLKFKADKSQRDSLVLVIAIVKQRTVCVINVWGCRPKQKTR